jgi:hypothetical protein
MHFIWGHEQAKPLDLTRDCFSFCIRACGRPLWGAKAFGSNQPHGLPFRDPAVGCRVITISIRSRLCAALSPFMYQMSILRRSRVTWQANQIK